jgi:hypothetical protein
LENPESQTRWYFKYFLGRSNLYFINNNYQNLFIKKLANLVHQNYLIEDKNKMISFLSVVITDANDRHIPQYKIILWAKQVNIYL